MKIDEIESEMSSQLIHHTLRRPPAPSTQFSGTKPETPGTAGNAAAQTPSPLPELNQPTLGTMGPSTAFLLEGQTTVGAVAMPASEAAATIEEAAILFASNKALAAEQLLHIAIADGHCADVTKIAWRMLFELYQFAGRQQEFEHLSMEYAHRFETSPPPWNPVDAPGMTRSEGIHSSSAPLVSFSGRLDRGCIRQVERIRKLAGNHQALHLDLSGVTEIDASGCTLLLDALASLRETNHRITLTGLPELTVKIKAIIEVGRRDENDAPWLLLLETLRLQNLERDFEEAGIDYCVTFEVSPPAFTPPGTGLAIVLAAPAAPAAHRHDNDMSDAFPMPRVIEGNTDQLILAIASWADKHDPAVIDCSRLMRIDFACAGRLLTGLAPFCSHGKTIEFRHVNQLVATLLDVIGLTDIVRVKPVKY